MDVVILAAGMGSRFGGLKQIEPMDEFGNFIIDYSIYDAIEAGFDRVVFIIKDEIFDEFKETIGKRIESHIKCEYTFQRLSTLPKGYSLPENREKPLGTAQALLAIKGVVNHKFVMINADDFYGKDAYKVAYNYLKSLDDNSKNVYGNVAYLVANTLTENGTVKRGVCFNDKDGNMTKLVESSVGFLENGKILATPLDKNITPFEVDSSCLVSMNMFCFTDDILDHIEDGFASFLDENKDDILKCEYLIPEVVSQLIQKGKVSTKLLSTKAKWYGVTYRDDKPGVVKAIDEYVKNGDYKKGLWQD